MNKQPIEVFGVTVDSDREQWLRLRAHDVTSTEVSALFNQNPYLTEFELFHQKVEGPDNKDFGSERMFWGKILEPAVARGYAELHNLEENIEVAGFMGADFGEILASATGRDLIRKMADFGDKSGAVFHAGFYCRDSVLRAGSSFDYIVVGKEPQDDRILEIKNVDVRVYGRSWMDEGDLIDPPVHIAMQVQQQMALLGINKAHIAALVGGNELKVVEQNIDLEVVKAMRAAIEKFWLAVHTGVAPKPNYLKDYDRVVCESMKFVRDQESEADEDLEQLIEKYLEAQEQKKQAEEIEKATKAQILEMAGSSNKIRSRFGVLSCGIVKETPGKIITQEMVGTVTGARKAFRNFRFTKAK